jgi:CheY-like chemotaxis protein
MSGHQLLKWIRMRRDLRLIPVVVLTGSESDADVKNAYEAGANSCLRKTPTQEEFYRLASIVQQYWLEHNIAPPLVMHTKP